MPTPPPGKEFDWQVMGKRGPEQSTLAHTWGKLQTTTYQDLCECPLSLVQVSNEDEGLKMLIKVLPIVANIYNSRTLVNAQ